MLSGGLQCTGQHPYAKNHLAQNVYGTEVEKFWSIESKRFGPEDEGPTVWSCPLRVRESRAPPRGGARPIFLCTPRAFAHFIPGPSL